MTWRYLGASVDGGPFEVDGINVWGHEWAALKGQFAEVADPRYGRRFSFQVWEIEAADTKVRFAAGEFSNCVWGFYVGQEAPHARQ